MNQTDHPMPLVVTAVCAILLASAFSALLVGAIRPFVSRLGLLDIPNGRKAHRQPTPLGGGIAIFLTLVMPSVLGFALASYWVGREAGVPVWLPEFAKVHADGVVSRVPMAMIILAGALALHVLGLIDDVHHLGPWTKLIPQLLVAGGVVVFADVRVLLFAGAPISYAVSIVWIVVIVNAVNFLDNMDGLAAGVTLICAATLLAAAASLGQWFICGWLCLLIGACLGFLLFNFPPARIFMGDAGSLVLGYFLAVLSMMTTYYTGSDSRPMYGVFVPLIVLAVPLYDFASVMFIRIREGRNPMIGDARHFSHRLIRRGLSPRSAVLTIYLCAGVTGIAAVLLPQVSNVGAWLLAAQVFGVLAIIALLELADGKR